MSFTKWVLANKVGTLLVVGGVWSNVLNIGSLFAMSELYLFASVVECFSYEGGMGKYR